MSRVRANCEGKDGNWVNLDSYRNPGRELGVGFGGWRSQLLTPIIDHHFLQHSTIVPKVGPCARV